MDIPIGGKYDESTWIALLELALPTHLRDPAFENAKPPIEMDVVEIAEVVLGATRLGNFNYLYHLGATQGRWRALVWLSKWLIESFASQRPLEGRERVLQTIWPWEDSKNLKDLTQEPVVLPEVQAPNFATTRSPSLEHLTDDTKPQNLGRVERLQHATLGFIWRSLGELTLSCTRESKTEPSVMRPEILEVIALMHHHGMVPAAIYNYTSNDEKSALQQPPTLNVFSSRILTSLSDAAWRAHERAVLEEAQAKGGQYADMRPEIPGSAYRVNVGGLTPEVWLELILWSCLHGGWIADGAAILFWLQRERPHWAPLSWRDHLHTLDPNAHARSEDWSRLSSLLQVRKSAPSDEPEGGHNIRRTISSEVVISLIDAVILSIDVGVGDRGLNTRRSITFVRSRKKFLERSELGLATTTWDATILKIMESGGIDIDKEPNMISRLLELVSQFGGEVNAPNTGPIPSYMLDGSAILVGLAHRALKAHIKAGDLRAALDSFSGLQEWADRNKMKSLEDFFANKQSVKSTSVQPKGLFESHFSGIDYPSFNVQLPPTISAPFLDLVLSNGAYDFAKWLIYSDDIDGPVIPEALYQDSLLKPALLRLAIDTNDKDLMTKVVGSSIANDPNAHKTLRGRVLRSFLDTQVKLKHWQTVQRTLDFLAQSSDTWNMMNFANLLRTMIEELPAAEAGDEDSRRNFGAVGRMLRDMLSARFGQDLRATQCTLEEQRIAFRLKCLLLTVSSLSEQWARWSMRTSGDVLDGYCAFHLPIQHFNVVLSGILQGQGSVAARRVLGIFWPHSIRNDPHVSAERGGVGKVGRFGRERGKVQRIVFRLPGMLRTEARFHGGLEPNIATLRLVLARCVEELRDARGQSLHWELTPQAKANSSSTTTSQATGKAPSTADSNASQGPDLSPISMVKWALHCLQRLRMSNRIMRAEVRDLMTEAELQDLRAKIPALDKLFGRRPGKGVESGEGAQEDEGVLDAQGEIRRLDEHEENGEHEGLCKK